jgi:RNA polymerase sigma factor (sigma-70 family)
LRRTSLLEETRERVATVNPIELNPIESFYRAHSNAVYAFLVSLCRDPVWAEDLMQDTFVKATRSMGGYRGGNPRSWLFSIARSVFIDDTRRRRAVPVEEIEDSAAQDTDVSELMLIERSLSKLPERQRTALLLTDMTGLSYAEVADALGCSNAAVKVLIHRARVSFRAHYTETSP